MATARGFTLVELLIVIAVLGVLAGITYTVINVPAQQGRARDADRKNDLRTIQTALEVFYNDSNRYPTSGAEYASLAPSYIQTLPNDPSAPRVYYYLPAAGASPQSYQLYAALERCLPGNCTDPQACFPTTGATCKAAAGTNCGGFTCSYGVSSSNTTPLL